MNFDAGNVVLTRGIVNGVDTQYLSGWLWSETVGWMHFDPSVGALTTLDIASDVTNIREQNTLSGWLGDGLIGKVKVIGNLSGNNIFDVLYNVGSSFAGQNTANTLNKIKKNIALSTRQIPTNSLLGSKSPTNAILYYKLSGGVLNYDAINVPGSEYFVKQSRTLIIEGADLLIDSDILLPTSLSDIK